MGNAKRPGGAGGVFNNPTSDLMHWASYWQMTVDVKLVNKH
jgi:hypothetical protein